MSARGRWMRRALLALAAAVAFAGLGAIGAAVLDGSREPVTAQDRGETSAARDRAAQNRTRERRRPSQRAEGFGLLPGESEHLLAVPGMGRFRVGCREGGRLVGRFRASENHASVDVVVDVGGGAPVSDIVHPGEAMLFPESPQAAASLRWQLAQVAANQTSVAIVDIASLAAAEAGSPGCTVWGRVTGPTRVPPR